MNVNAMIQNPMLSINVKLWRSLSVLLIRSWRVYAFVGPVCLMNIMQFVYLYRMWGDAAQFILNAFFAAAIFDALLRTCLVICNRNKFEAFMSEFNILYCDIEESGDTSAKRMLEQATLAVRKISIFNLTASFCDVIGALLCPLFSEKRGMYRQTYTDTIAVITFQSVALFCFAVHPFGVAIPGVDMSRSPLYEIVYVLQFPTPFVLTALYMPFVSLFACFAMFGKVTLQILQRRLECLCVFGKKERQLYREFRACIQYHKRITRYVNKFNSLVTYIVCVEFILFGSIICSLLFCLNIIESITTVISIIMYIFTMLYVLFTYYWQANELYIESLKISEAAYAMHWYNGSARFKRTLLNFILQTQEPLKIMVGNVYPMTLEIFQSLLNVSYSYFTLLRGVYKK